MPAHPPQVSVPSATRVALGYWLREVRRAGALSALAVLLPGLGSICVFYGPPLVVAKLLAAASAGQVPTVETIRPYLLWLGGTWLTGEILWRAGIHCVNRLVGSGMRSLYECGLDELLAKDLAFFQDNFTGALTKRTLGFARAYDGFIATLTMQVFPQTLPLLFATVVLWRYSPWLIAALLMMIAATIASILPLIRRWRKLVLAREQASSAVAGHLSDTIGNMEAVRAFARESHEAELHRRNVGRYIDVALRSWDYHNLRIAGLTSPLYVMTNVLGLGLAVALSPAAEGASVEAIFVTFSYFATATRLMFDFHNIYRNLETHIAEGAEFTELLAEGPRVRDVRAPLAAAPKDASVHFVDVHFRHRDRADAPLFEGFNLRIESGEKVGLVGHSGGGKSTVTRLLLRFMDVDRGRVLVGGQDIAHLRQADLRAQIAYVPQDPLMFHRTLIDNIRFGRLDATLDEVRRATTLAHATERPFVDAPVQRIPR